MHVTWTLSNAGVRASANQNFHFDAKVRNEPICIFLFVKTKFKSMYMYRVHVVQAGEAFQVFCRRGSCDVAIFKIQGSASEPAAGAHGCAQCTCTCSFHAGGSCQRWCHC